MILKFKKIPLIFIIVLGCTLQGDVNPNIFAMHSVPIFDEIKNVKQMKAAFFKYMLPFIIKENRKINFRRSLIINNQISDNAIKKLAKQYRIKDINKASLLNAIDIIPVSLVLAQAAVESDWGRSRFAKEWNNYFGIWCFKKGCGVVPRNRNKNSKHEVMGFYSTDKAIEYYLLNLNRNHAYQLLRKIRADKRKHNLKLTGESLAKGLSKYSSKGDQYIKLVQSIIRQNKLIQFD